MSKTLSVTKKEFGGYFASPAAFLFLGVFLAVTLFVFFWVESFFSRNLADVRPLFDWMPLLLIFLVAALTMRSWSEERRSGTLETLLTSPVSPLQLVLGKFFAALGLTALALALTLPLAMTVSELGNLDWGPVLGGYLAALFLAAAYIAIGLYMSSLTDNPIVALILTVLVCALFYVVGSTVLTGLTGYEFATLLSLLGSGARFESITRGVLDIRDLYYYVSVVGVFLTLNVFALEKLRWSGNACTIRHRRIHLLAILVALNFIAANLWLHSVSTLRLDMTEGKRYSLSDATKQYLGQLQEPMLIRGYFSSKTHALLAPLVPQLHDLLEEYAVQGGGRVKVEFIDPHDDRELEEEAADKYGIRPIPFRMDGKYQSGVVNAYFNLVVAYGDQHEILGYEDLIDVKVKNDTDIDVVLKNPEYALTSAIRRALGTFRSGGNPFAMLDASVTLNAYLSDPSKMPAEMAPVLQSLNSAMRALETRGGGNLKVVVTDPEAGDGAVAAALENDYGFAPQIASLLDPRPFWFTLMLEYKGNAYPVTLPETLDEAAFTDALNASVKRLSPGVMKTIALYKPQTPPAAPWMGAAPQGKQYTQMQEFLSQSVRIIDADLSTGHVSADADLLMVMAPDALDEKQRFAIDQFLMQGGTVILATSPFDVTVGRSIDGAMHTSGLEAWLDHYGLHIDDTLILDPVNAALPLPVPRQLGPITVNEIQMMPYPYFPDMRESGLDMQNAITSGLGQLSLNWASPIELNATKNGARSVSLLARSGPQSWTSASLQLIPDYLLFPDTGFAPAQSRSAHTMAVAVEGVFDSFYAGKPSPLAGDEVNATGITGVIERSGDAARIILIASNTFATDTALQLASQGMGTLYTKPYEMLQNAIDWSLEDRALLQIRSRATFARTLPPLDADSQLFLELLNYVAALFGLSLIWLLRRRAHKSALKRYQAVLKEV